MLLICLYNIEGMFTNIEEVVFFILLNFCSILLVIYKTLQILNVIIKLRTYNTRYEIQFAFITHTHLHTHNNTTCD